MPTKKSAPDFALQVEEARAIRLESLAEAWKAAKEHQQEYKDIARYILKEARALEKVAARFLKGAEGRKTAARACYKAMIQCSKAPGFEQVGGQTKKKAKKAKKTG